MQLLIITSSCNIKSFQKLYQIVAIKCCVLGLHCRPLLDFRNALTKGMTIINDRPNIYDNQCRE